MGGTPDANIKNRMKRRLTRRRTGTMKLQETAANLYVLALLGVFPLICHNNYIDIQTFKAYLFRAISAVYLSAVLLIFLSKVLCRKAERELEKNSTARRPFRTAWFPGCFLILLMCAAVISAVFSKWPSLAFTGSMGRNVGTIDYLLYGLTCLCLVRYFHPWKYLMEMVSAGIGLACLLIILNFWGIDPLGMYRNLIPEQHGFFLGTVGNINTTSTFACLVMPLYLGTFYFSRTMKEKLLYGGMTLLVTYTGFAASSDSFLLGCAGAFLLLTLCAARMGEGAWKLAECFFLIIGSAWLMRFTLLIAGRFSISSPLLDAYENQVFLSRALSIPVLSGGLICIIGITLLLSLDKNGRIGRILPAALSIAGIAAVIFIVGCVLAVNLYPQCLNTGWGSRLWVFYIKDSFGSGRGYIWKKSLEMWKSYSPGEKLFGCGTDCFYMQMTPLYGREMTKLFGAPFADAHCEFLQMLITTGIAGTAGYFGALAGSLAIALKHVKKQPMLTAGMLAIASYLAQGVVNNPVPACSPILFVIMGITGAYYCNVI